MMGTQIFYR
jgi:uncharacterized protein YjbJ (UPF0337 family)